ncbi:RNA methyltransferase [Candidatus Woesearchaeota archaeon]|nr:RNA methyltransferase [Candidatus Woesearchaeota archaeon]
MLSVVLVEPETPGNIGSVARVMKNFGVRQLLLVNPKCSHLDGEAYGRAMHARDVLKEAVVVKNFGSCIRKFDCAVATTSDLGSDYNVVRSPIAPNQFARQLKGKRGKIAIVFGRESSGLTTSEIAACDVLVTIQSSKKYPALNLSHSVAIILYELFKSATSIRSHITLSSRHEKGLAMSMANAILARMDFGLEGKREIQSMVWSRLISKAFLTKREMYALLGFLRKVIKMIKSK